MIPIQIVLSGECEIEWWLVAGVACLSADQALCCVRERVEFGLFIGLMGF